LNVKIRGGGRDTSYLVSSDSRRTLESTGQPGGGLNRLSFLKGIIATVWARKPEDSRGKNSRGERGRGHDLETPRRKDM